MENILQKQKNSKYRIGIDVGGTTVDFAIVNNNNELIDTYKILITQELNQCVTSSE